jgi:cytochrome P450
MLNICPPGKLPTYEDIKGMKYRECRPELTSYIYAYGCVVRAVVNESLRLFTPVHTTIRASGPRPCVVPLGKGAETETPLYIPPEVPVNMVPILIHRRQDTWGPDADVFDPDRWLDERFERVLKNPLIFVPFNAGPRIVSNLS